VGVSPTAPYHHFRGRPDLVAAVAADALAQLDDALARADRPGDSPADRIRAMGVAYVLFAVDHPAHVRLVFQAAPHHTTDGVLPTEAPAFRHLARAVAALASEPDRQAALSIALWSLVHGLALLLIEGPLRSASADRAAAEALARRVVEQFPLDR
jgi:AcrR family transcriptional regulator